MATHPVEPEPLPPGPEPGGATNPSHLPVEPEFGPQMPPAEPEDPLARPAPG
ncbi:MULTISPECIES: stereocilin [Ramlibacter]|uniref:Stereocilin n=1 Tax=Ramlibacter aquaticus TaxID=2780094 RepID=A0ABR9SIY5_9BURK|nr:MULTISPECIES: stereocilin [Ramlibacter]MBE7941717.1 stereocilin [Ramlibacter aquaticus]